MTSADKKRIIFSVLEFAVTVMSVGTYVVMVLSKGKDALTDAGLGSLKYYTVLSNLYAGVVCLICGLFRLSGKKSRVLSLLKLSSASCVAVTFAVVMSFLGLVYGYDVMFSGVNLFFHLIVPITAFLSFIFSESLRKISFKASFMSLIPTALYGFVYLANVVINGAEGNDFYHFADWGIPVGCLILLLILGLNLFHVFLLRRVQGHLSKAIYGGE